uniref:Rib/alpha-like domain-containing protein n=1 Tax=Gardnerella vaginalis TaxID=2702 RepID=UPI000517D022
MTTTNPSKHTSSKSSRKRSAHKVHTLPLATMAALLTAATCLGSQPAMAVTARTPLSTPTYTTTAESLTKAAGAVYQDREYVPLDDKKPWLQYPNILEFRRLRGRNSDATEIKSDEEGSDSSWRTVNDRTAMYAHVETRGNSDYLIFDIFFNNNAKSMVDKSNKQWYLWQVPYAIADLDSNGLYKSDTVTNLRYDAYRPKKDGHILSQDPEAFVKDDSLSFSVPNMQQTDKHFGKDDYALYQVGIGLNPGNKVYDDLDQIFHGNANEALISRMAGDQTTYAFYNPQYNKNYGLGITVAKPYDDVAYHMHAELKLRPGAINKNADNYNDKYANIQNAWTWANSGSWGATTKSAYTVISGRDPNNDADKDGKLKRNKTDSTAPKIYYKGKEITDKTKTIKLKEGDKLSFTTTDNKGYIEKFSISGLTDTPITKQGAGSEDNPLSSDEITVTKKMKDKEVTITSEDGSGNVTTRKVTVKVTKKKELAKEHPITGKTITTTVGGTLPKLTEIDNFVTVKYGNKLDKQPTLSWKGTAPNTNTAGVLTHEITGTYSDNSTSTATVTINVKPQKPVIDTDLTDYAGKKGQKVTVSVGSGIPTDANITTTVKLFDKDNKEIGSTTTINGDKAEITVDGEIPEGDVYATTTVTKPDRQDGPKKTIPGFNLTSEKSDTKQATKPKDNEKPTITATADSLSVEVGQDLKIHIVAKDDVKVELVPNAQALQQGLGLDVNELSSRIKSSQTTNTDKEKDFDLTVTKMQPKEVGTHTITFTVTDSAGNTGTAKLTITV